MSVGAYPLRRPAEHAYGASALHELALASRLGPRAFAYRVTDSITLRTGPNERR